MNTLQYNDAKQGRSLHVSLTNEAADSLGGAIGMFIVGRQVERTASKEKQVAYENQPLLPNIDKAGAIDIGDSIPNEQPQANASLSTERQQLRTIFRYKGDTLELEEPRLKATSKLDYARKLTYLFLYGHEMEGRDEVPRSTLVDILTKAKVYDTNTAAWIRSATALKSEDDKLRLNKEGKENAVTTLKAVLDSSVENSWMPDHASTRSQKSSQQGSQKPASIGKRSSIDVKSVVAKWKGQFPSSNEIHNKINSAKPFEKGLFALWGMNRVGGDSCKIVSRTLLAKFLLDAVVVKVDDRNLGRALESPEAKNKVIKVDGGYQIQPPGSSHVEKLLELDKQKVKSK